MRQELEAWEATPGKDDPTESAWWRAARDVVVLRCMTPGADDRAAFYVGAEKAFGRPLGSPSVDLCERDRELKACLTLVYHMFRR